MDTQTVDALTAISSALGNKGWTASLALILWAVVAVLRGDFKLNVPKVTKALGKLSHQQTFLLIATAGAVAGILGSVTSCGLAFTAASAKCLANGAMQGIITAFTASGLNSAFKIFVKDSGSKTEATSSSVV